MRPGMILIMACCWLGSMAPAAAAEQAVSPDDLAALQASDEHATTEESEPARVSMEFQDANLKDVLKTFSQQTGLNVIATGDVGDQPITLYLEDVTVTDALDQILRAANLTYERPVGSEIYIVKSLGTQTVPTITRVYRLRFARVSASVLAKAAAAFGDKTPFEASLSTDTNSAGGGTSSSSGEEGKIGVDAIVKALLTSHGSVVVDGRTNSLIVTDVPENFPRLEAALAALDVRTQQILVDAEVIETSLGKVKDLGIKWGTGTDGQLVSFTPGTGGRKTRFPFNVFTGEEVAPTTSGPSQFPLSTLSFASFQGALRALESDSDTKILARPKVLTLDNESAVIRLTTNEAIGFSTSAQATTGLQTSTPEREITGVVLVVTPQVNHDGYITMLVEPSVTKTVASQISAPTGQAKPRDPKTRSSRTLVRIRSGDTLVVGGLIDRSDQQTLQQVPVLSGIPFLGEAFKDKEINNSTSELMVFITPRLLEEPSESQLASVATPLGPREQESSGGARQEAIEHTLNTLEGPQQE